MATSVLHGSIAEPKVALRKFTIGDYHKLGEAGILNQKKKYHESRYREGSIAVQAFPDVLVQLEDIF
jgi:hypothetical protein